MDRLTWTVPWCVFTACVAGGCVEVLDEPIDESASEAGPRPRGGYVPLPPDLRTVAVTDAEELSGDEGSIHLAAAGTGRTTIFLNRRGGTYTPGANDSRTNRSSVPSRVSVVPPWNASAGDWSAVKSCVRAMFSRFNVDVTDVDPGNAPHFEVVLGGTASDIGMEDSSGWAPLDDTDCQPIPNAVSFVFPTVLYNDPQYICEITAQEVSHSFGLDHAYLCADPMTYLYGCGSKTFQNVEASCGEESPRACACSARQNSVAFLTARLGRFNAALPTIAIEAPLADDTVQAGFAVSATARDGDGIAKVEMRIDDEASLGADTAAPYEWTTPADLAPGVHRLTATAHDRLGGRATTSIDVTVEERPADDPSDPGDGDDGTEGEPTPEGPSGGDDGGGGEAGDEPGGAADGDLTGGCAAAADGGQGGAAALVSALVLLAGAARRRRARHRRRVPKRALVGPDDIC